jgi:nitrogen fixation protein NifB
MKPPNAATTEVMSRHPCFSDLAHDRVGRVHLAIAPRCNIQCNFCERNICAAVAIRHPGWSSKLMSVPEALELIRSFMGSGEGLLVVGVAGPGDPLANDETFEAMGLIHHEFPSTLQCVSTNGLLLEDRLQDVIDVGIRALTVTVNAAESQVGKRIYSWVSYGGSVHRGDEAAGLLLTKQFDGIAKAIDAGLAVKVNAVLIPGINEGQMPKIAARSREAGVGIMNIMPLIPSGRMRHLPSPSCDELRRARSECEEILPQFHRCEQCRADAVFLPHRPHAEPLV